MVNDRHYHTTGLAGEETYEADGVISSSVDQSEIPHENDIIDDEVIYVHIEGKWIRYEYYIPE